MLSYFYSVSYKKEAGGESKLYWQKRNKVFNHFPTSTIFWPTPAPCPEAGVQAAAQGPARCRQLKAQAGRVVLAPGALAAHGIAEPLPLGCGPGAGSQQSALVQSRASHHSYSELPFGFVTEWSSRSTLVILKGVLVKSAGVPRGDAQLCSPPHAWPRKVSSPAGAEHQSQGQPRLQGQPVGRALPSHGDLPCLWPTTPLPLLANMAFSPDTPDTQPCKAAVQHP